MISFLHRRQFLVGAVGGACILSSFGSAFAQSSSLKLRELEQTSGARLGLWALDTGTNKIIEYRSSERFPMCSTFKVVLVGAVLEKCQANSDLLSRNVTYVDSDLVEYSPVTKAHVESGMTVAELCTAALQYSDNTAANLLLGLVGGPKKVTNYAREIGDATFRLDRIEPELNTALPNDVRDTTTAQAMGMSLRRLLLGDALREDEMAMFQDWMKHNTTGAARIRAAIPSGWDVADKTGSGHYGAASDVAVIWPANSAPWIVAIYTSSSHPDAQYPNKTIAEATQILVDTWTS
jgi:beta-lactamase class A